MGQIVNKFKRMVKEITEELGKVHYEDGDLSDVGNEIGIVVGKYIDETAMGYEKKSFFHGLEHGISLEKNHDETQ
jgi:hypothetical protein